MHTAWWSLGHHSVFQASPTCLICLWNQHAQLLTATHRQHAAQGGMFWHCEKPSLWPCFTQRCPESREERKRTSHLSQVIFKLLLGPEDSTNGKLQVPARVATPQKGLSDTGGAALVLGGVHSAHCFFKRVKRKNPVSTLLTQQGFPFNQSPCSHCV